MNMNDLIFIRKEQEIDNKLKLIHYTLTHLDQGVTQRVLFDIEKNMII